VTLGADFDLDVLLGGTGLDHFAACTTNGGLLVVGMDAFLHVVHLFRILVKGQIALSIHSPWYDITPESVLQVFFLKT